MSTLAGRVAFIAGTAAGARLAVGERGVPEGSPAAVVPTTLADVGGRARPTLPV